MSELVTFNSSKSRHLTASILYSDHLRVFLKFFVFKHPNLSLSKLLTTYINRSCPDYLDIRSKVVKDFVRLCKNVFMLNIETNGKFNINNTLYRNKEPFKRRMLEIIFNGILVLVEETIFKKKTESNFNYVPVVIKKLVNIIKTNLEGLPNDRLTVSLVYNYFIDLNPQYKYDMMSLKPECEDYTMIHKKFSTPDDLNYVICTSTTIDVSKDRFNSYQVNILKDWLIYNEKYPHCSYNTKKELSLKTNLTVYQIRQWIERNRRKINTNNTISTLPVYTIYNHIIYNFIIFFSLKRENFVSLMMDYLMTTTNDLEVGNGCSKRFVFFFDKYFLKFFINKDLFYCTH